MRSLTWRGNGIRREHISSSMRSRRITRRSKTTRTWLKQYSKKYYELLFRAKTYISTETPFHLNVIRSNNKYYRRSIAENTFVFLQHGVTYMKCHGPNLSVPGRAGDGAGLYRGQQREGEGGRPPHDGD